MELYDFDIRNPRCSVCDGPLDLDMLGMSLLRNSYQLANKIKVAYCSTACRDSHTFVPKNEEDLAVLFDKASATDKEGDMRLIIERGLEELCQKRRDELASNRSDDIRS